MEEEHTWTEKYTRLRWMSTLKKKVDDDLTRRYYVYPRKVHFEGHLKSESEVYWRVQELIRMFH